MPSIGTFRYFYTRVSQTVQTENVMQQQNLWTDLNEVLAKDVAKEEDIRLERIVRHG